MYQHKVVKAGNLELSSCCSRTTDAVSPGLQKGVMEL